MLTLTAIVAILGFYSIEVLLGSSRSVYDCEIGAPSSDREKAKLSPHEFFGKIAPILLTCMGIVFMMHRLLGGSA